MEQELLTLPEHMSSPPVFSVVCVAQSLIFCVVFCRSLFVCFTLDHCIVCPSSHYDFWLRLWYIQTFLILHWFWICHVTKIIQTIKQQYRTQQCCTMKHHLNHTINNKAKGSKQDSQNWLRSHINKSWKTTIQSVLNLKHTWLNTSMWSSSIFCTSS